MNTDHELRRYRLFFQSAFSNCVHRCLFSFAECYFPPILNTMPAS